MKDDTFNWTFNYHKLQNISFWSDESANIKSKTEIKDLVQKFC